MSQPHRPSDPSLRTPAQLSAFMQSLSDTLSRRDQDLRTLKASKQLHAAAEAQGYDNWQQYRAALVRQDFMATLGCRYGLSAADAAAAWQRLPKPVAPESSGAALAEEHCAALGMIPRLAAVADTGAGDPKLARLNAGILADLREVNTAGDGDPGALIYGQQRRVLHECCFRLGSQSELCLLVAADDHQPIRGELRSQGWGTAAVTELSAADLAAIAALFEAPIRALIADAGE